MRKRTLQSLLRHIDQREISARAKAETRSREIHLPPISVYRWWARRTEAVSGALLDAAVRGRKKNNPLLVADPFAGGGVIPLAALKRGHSVYAQDLNPWVAKGLATMLALPDPGSIEQAGKELIHRTRAVAEKAYATTFRDGRPCQISHSFRVAVSCCSKCGVEHRLFPHALVSLKTRKEKNGPDAILACPDGHLFIGSKDGPSQCSTCSKKTEPTRSYLSKRVCACPNCGHEESLEQRAASVPWRWELVLLEKSDGRRREFELPTDVERAQADGPQWQPTRALGKIPEAHETRVLRRHGFTHWEQVYPIRQRSVLERLLAEIDNCSSNPQVRGALEMAVFGIAEMAGLLSRWDRYYLKSYESMASHRFNFTTFAAEPNVVGEGAHGRGSLSRRLEMFMRAAHWNGRNGIAMQGAAPLNASGRRFSRRPRRPATIVVGSSERMLLPAASVDLVLTDPPYHDDVQYHELSLPFRAWAGLETVRLAGEAVAIPHSADLKGHAEYRGILTRIFKELRRVLRPEGRLIFSYANREPAAWVNLFAALRASEFRPVGYTILHSENEHDHAKRKVRACTLDLILELAPAGPSSISQWRPGPIFESDEEKYLLAVGEAFLLSGTLVNGWESKLVGMLKSEIFLVGESKGDQAISGKAFVRPVSKKNIHLLAAFSPSETGTRMRRNTK